jgi:hypothetical protein
MEGEVYVGIDVSKASLDVALETTGQLIRGSVLEVQQNRAQAKSHGMRVMRNVTESFGEDAHHDREKA